MVCAPQVPCGSATAKVETATGIDQAGQRGERRSPTCSNKVKVGEADAGLVYKTDVKGAGVKVQGVLFPEASEAVNVYPIATGRQQES